MTTPKKIGAVIWFLIAAAFFLFVASRHSQGSFRAVANAKPIVVTIEKTQRGTAYKLESKPKRVDELLHGLGELLEQRGRDYPVLGLIEDDAPLTAVSDIRGLAQKTGFTNVRTFVFNRESGMMAEVKLCAAVPISENPPPDPQCSSSQ